MAVLFATPIFVEPCCVSDWATHICPCESEFCCDKCHEKGFVAGAVRNHIGGSKFFCHGIAQSNMQLVTSTVLLVMLQKLSLTGAARSELSITNHVYLPSTYEDQ